MSKHHNGELNAITLWFARGLLVVTGAMVGLLYSQTADSIEALKTFQLVTASRLATIEEAVRNLSKVR